jgi:branched-subunit amino acid transport protein
VNNLIPLILGMSAVTYLPRLLPFLILSNRTIHKRLDTFLKCIPAAAIGALIIPSVLSATPDMPMALSTQCHAGYAHGSTWRHDFYTVFWIVERWNYNTSIRFCHSSIFYPALVFLKCLNKNSPICFVAS